MVDWSIAAVAGKAVVYATCLVAGGGVLFLSLFAARLNEAERRYIMRLVRATAVVGILATIARIMTLSGMLGGDLASAVDATLIRIVLESSEGPAALVRLVGLLTIAISGFGNALVQALSLTGALAAVGSFALTGHTSTLEPNVLFKLLVPAHLVAAAYWIGALLPLRRLTASPEHARVAEVLKRFGNVALVTVAILIAAGALLAWLLLVGSLHELFASIYGRLVLLKVALVAALLTLAAVNKLSLTPSVAAGAPGAMKTLRRSITAELLLAAAILTVTAIFTTVTGPPLE